MSSVNALTAAPNAMSATPMPVDTSNALSATPNMPTPAAAPRAAVPNSVVPAAAPRAAPPYSTKLRVAVAVALTMPAMPTTARTTPPRKPPKANRNIAIACAFSAATIAMGANMPACSVRVIFRSSNTALICMYLCICVSVRTAACSMAVFVPVTLAVISSTARAFCIRNCAAAMFSTPNTFVR